MPASATLPHSPRPLVRGPVEATRYQALLKAEALQQAVLTSADFSIIATDERGIIQVFNVGAERMGFPCKTIGWTGRLQARGSPLRLTVTVRPGGLAICRRCSWPRNW